MGLLAPFVFNRLAASSWFVAEDVFLQDGHERVEFVPFDCQYKNRVRRLLKYQLLLITSLMPPNDGGGGDAFLGYFYMNLIQ